MKQSIFISIASLFLFTTSSVAADHVSVLDAPHAPGELIVKFNSKSKEEFEISSSKIKILGGKKTKTLGGGDLFLYSFANDESMAAAFFELQEFNDVEYVEPNYYYFLQTKPNDPDFRRQYGLNNEKNRGGGISAREAWSISTGSPIYG